MERNKPNTFFSKSLFLRGLKCYKSLYLQKYHPELKDELPESQQRLYETGFNVGCCARQLFPGGVEIPYERLSLQKQIQMTKEEIEHGTLTLYESAFQYNEIFIKSDILHKGSDGWELYEVKNALSIKDDNFHIEDVAIQYHVLRGSGLPVTKAFLVHLNGKYIKNGDIEIDKLFTIEDITESVKGKQPFIAEKVSEMKKMLMGDLPPIDIGKQCNLNGSCDFQQYCWQDIPDDSIFRLSGIGIDKYAYYQRGIIKLSEFPLDKLNSNQRIQAEAFLNKTDYLDKKTLKDFLASLWYPLCFLDFETYMCPIPIYDGSRPYQQIPFQYSLHILEHQGADIKHIEYLAEPNREPRKELLTTLLEHIPAESCVLMYTDFEKHRLRELAENFPEYSHEINRIIENLTDLAVPFRKRAYYHYAMNGSSSIKAVFPVLIPGESYGGLEINNGMMAMDAYFRMCQSKDTEEIEAIRKALLEYCYTDTLAMVKIFHKLRELAC